MSAMSTPRLSDTSYAVLGLLDLFEPATPYQLKQIAQVSIFHFWSIPHTQLYTECARLAEAGLVDERREESGRRRRDTRLSADRRTAWIAWRADPNTDLYELRDPGLL
jgi:PadR family transcriptional regulator AphA